MLPYDQREKCRLRGRLESGEEVAIFTARGTVLRDGDLLTGEDQRVVQVVAAQEPTYARVLRQRACAGALRLPPRQSPHPGADRRRRCCASASTRCCAKWSKGLGARVAEETAVFEPEQGAYAGAGHSHRDDGHLLAPVPLRQKIHRPGDPAAA